jgi:DNA replication and repair protein RecF
VSLERLFLQDFRNFRDGEFHLPPEGVALVGANAQGKSNFLEAIQYLEMLRSFRGSQDARLIRFGAPLFRLEGDVRSGSLGHGTSEPIRLSIGFQREGGAKRVRVDGTPPKRLADALGHLGSVVFTPDDIRLVSGGPQERRRFLDIMLSLNVPGYLEALQRYRQILTRRNAALRGQESRESVRAWNPLLAREGGKILQARDTWVREVAAPFSDIVARVSASEAGMIGYRPGVPGMMASTDIPLENPEVTFLEALEGGEVRERRQGITLAGPHRDDLQLVMVPGGTGVEAHDSRDLREYGSGGQRRTAALALRLVEARTVELFRKRTPMLLLDDVFAELDEARALRVLELLQSMPPGQVILTAPRDAEVRLHRGGMALWRIDGGTIETGGDG